MVNSGLGTTNIISIILMHQKAFIRVGIAIYRADHGALQKF